MRTLVLCSGGLDSIVVAKCLQEQKHEVCLLYVDYGSLNRNKEVEALHACTQRMKLHWLILPLQTPLWDRSAMTTPWLDKGGNTLKGLEAWIPARNLILLSLAAGQAIKDDFNIVAIGNIAGGTNGDNKVEFTDLFDNILEYIQAPVNPKRVHCWAPVAHLTKSEVIEFGAELKVPFELTWSCYRGGDVHCGQCAACTSRIQAFARTQVKDPTQYSF